MTEPDATSGQDSALAEALPGLEAGDRVTIHELGCAAERGERCNCDPIVVIGPSGEA